ncbi:hypothetical protein B0T22DRAFT_530482 [Podospora appendiculata]|uniref:Uncharacterized protein n=1 Tax=Podospora appendiculata TaxID=314037 RepID=A0AAE1C6V8_9PEZI|nr:hypothetical protein B0T22DRAFT_531479 [Podospora appendiculata]KAK3684267.1 hypothetical protein B0T22DRAFT_530482 [Podospora appendiculata]
MAEQGPLGLYKCKRQSQAQSPSDDRRQHQPKKQKLSHPTRPPPFFWDSLPGVPLTENALHELDRRNRERARSARSLSRKPARGPVTRRAAAEPLPRCVPVDPERIRSFARQGGPDLSDLRGLGEPASECSMSLGPSSLGRRKRGSASASTSQASETKTPGTKTTKSTGPYDGAFQQHLVDYGIYPDQYEYPNGRIPPELGNMDEIARFLAQPRPSLSPTRCSNDDFRKFKRADAHAAKERQGTAFVVPIISGDVGDSRCVAGEIPFTNLDHLTNGSLFPGNPDLYHGARPEQLDRKVRAELEGRIIPSTQQDLPIAPNFFLAVKGPNRSLAVAQRQACYDGALGARGMQDLLYGEPEPVHDNNAYTMTFRPKYVMTQVGAYALTGSYDGYRQGVAAYRNGRDWAKQQRDNAIEQANKRVASAGTGLCPPDDNPALGFATVSDSSLEH